MVLPSDLQTAALLPECDVDDGALRLAVLPAVAQQVVEDALELQPVDADHIACQPFWHSEMAVCIALRGNRSQVLRQIRLHADGFHLEVHFAEVQLGEQEQVVDETLEQQDAVVEHVEVVLLLFRRPRDAIAQRTDVTAHGRQRRAQVVGDARNELLAIVLVADALIARMRELLPHALKIRTGHADLVFGLHLQGLFEIALTDGRRCRAQFSERRQHLLVEQLRQIAAEAQDDGDQSQQDDSQYDFEHGLPRDAPRGLWRARRNLAQRDDCQATLRRDVAHGKDVLRPELRSAALAKQPLRLRLQARRIAALRDVEQLAVAQHGEADALLFQEAAVFQEFLLERLLLAGCGALVVIGPRAHVTDEVLDRKRGTPLRPEQREWPEVVGIRQVQDADEQRAKPQERAERDDDHQEVRQPEALAQREVAPAHQSPPPCSTLWMSSFEAFARSAYWKA